MEPAIITSPVKAPLASAWALVSFGSISFTSSAYTRLLPSDSTASTVTTTHPSDRCLIV